jgi:hypothetical protein
MIVCLVVAAIFLTAVERAEFALIPLGLALTFPWP